jgi:hypothetical protein
MPIANPLIFYPWRVIELLTAGFKWWRLTRRYRAIMGRILAMPGVAERYVDAALQPAAAAEADNLVRLFADRIPSTYGAPPKQVVAAGAGPPDPPRMSDRGPAIRAPAKGR